MTLIELLNRIRQEVERLKGICAAQIKVNPGQTFPFVMEMTGYDKLLSFLDTIEDHVPENEEMGTRFDEAAEKYINDAMFKWSYDDEDGIEQYVYDAFKAGFDACKQSLNMY